MRRRDSRTRKVAYLYRFLEQLREPDPGKFRRFPYANLDPGKFRRFPHANLIKREPDPDYAIQFKRIKRESDPERIILHLNSCLNILNFFIYFSKYILAK